MRNKDWTLVFFTTLSQMSVGIILCLTLLNYFNDDPAPLIGMGLSLKNPVLLALAFAGLATVISFLHLGNPSSAPNALNNLSGSWISREILALGIYSLSLVVILGLGWANWNPRYVAYLLILSALSGIALLWMMIRIYVMPTIPAWNSWYTYVSFGSTALCLGLLTFLSGSHFGFVTLYAQTVTALLVSLIAILLFELVSALFHQLRLSKMDTGFDGPILDGGAFYKLFLFRMALLVIAVSLVTLLLFEANPLPGNCQYVGIFPILILVISQELMGRLLFYSSYFRIGV